MEDGQVYNAQSSLIPKVGIAVTLQDITHLKELDRIKTDFVNTVSHDLRSPLTAVYGFIGLIDRVGPINQQQAEFINHIQTSLQHITYLINDLLELGRVEAGYDLLKIDFNMKDILRQAMGDLEYQYSEKMQDVVLSVPDDIPVISGNPLHLQRMVTNLIDNAIKFTPPMGRIHVRCTAEAGQLILEVADNGPGIPLADQPHIFEKFYRGSNLSQITLGTGLGLSIVKSIVEQHQGRIWLESSPLGTTFSVILPVK
jgi:two-component system NtrC family sensor kinase